MKLQEFNIELKEEKVQTSNPGSPGKIAHLAFEVSDIFKEIQRLQEKGLVFEKPAKRTSCSWFSFSKDPDGIMQKISPGVKPRF